jgi:hypothetical protein
MGYVSAVYRSLLCIVLRTIASDEENAVGIAECNSDGAVGGVTRRLEAAIEMK